MVAKLKMRCHQCGLPLKGQQVKYCGHKCSWASDSRKRRIRETCNTEEYKRTMSDCMTGVKGPNWQGGRFQEDGHWSLHWTLLTAEELILVEQTANSPDDDSFVANVMHDVTNRLDQLAVQYHNPHITVLEQEALYRIWLLRVVMEQLAQRMGRADSLGESKFENRLHAIAEEIEPSLVHKKLFRSPEGATTCLPGVFAVGWLIVLLFTLR